MTVAIAATLGAVIERQRTSTALENTEKNLNALLDSQNDYVFILDLAGRILHSNPPALKCLGYALPDLRGRTILDIVPPGDARAVSTWLAENARGEASTSFLPLVTAHGTHIPVETKVTTASWNNHPVLLVVSRDITDRIQALDGFKRYQARTMAILEAIPDTILRLRHDATVIDSMTAGAAQQGFSEKYLGFDLPKITSACRDAISRAVTTGEMEILEIEIPTENSKRTLECRLVVFGEDEILAIVRDISERAHLEQMKTDFVNRASHDLRTPLTTARLMVDLIQGGGTEEELQEYWKILTLELQRQNDLICTLLTAGRLEQGTLDLKCVPLDPLLVLENSLGEVRHLATKENLELSFDLPESLPSIKGDSSALQRCFTNLLDNAIKYTPAGGCIHFDARELEGGLSVRITDNGIGINPEDLPNLFDRFFRAGNAVRAEIPGTGIGLYIVKSLIKGHEGRISVESRPGGGTTFEVWLPVADDADDQQTRSL